MADSLKHKILSGVFWQGLERAGQTGIQFLMTLVLARLLIPEEFGMIALLLVFTAICDTIVNAGFGTAVIQKKELTQDDCSSVFWINCSVALVLYVICFFSAPWIAAFYHQPQLVKIFRVFSIIPVIHSLVIVHWALLVREMRFKIRCCITWISLFLSAVVGIGLAYFKFGVWALVGQQIAYCVCSALLVAFLIHWHPFLTLKLSNVKPLFNFGYKIFVSRILDTLFQNVYLILIGKLYTFNALGLYNQGNMVPRMTVTTAANTIGGTLLPAFSKTQDSRIKTAGLMIQTIRIMMFCNAGGLMLLAVSAPELIPVLFSAKWLPAVPFLQIGCLTYFLFPLHVANLQMIVGKGRSDINLYLEIIKKIQLVLIIMITCRWGILGFVWGEAAGSLISFIINAYPGRKLIGVGPFKQVWLFKDSALIALATGVIIFVLGMQLRNWNVFIVLTLKIILFGILYLFLHFLLKTKSFAAIRNITVPYINRIFHK